MVRGGWPGVYFFVRRASDLGGYSNNFYSVGILENNMLVELLFHSIRENSIVGASEEETPRGAGWFAGWLVGWLAVWLVGWLAGWLGGWFAGWLVGWLVGCLAGGLVG